MREEKRREVEHANCVEIEIAFACLMMRLNQKRRDELQLVRNFLIQHIFYCKITTHPELQTFCRTLNFDTDYWKPGLGCCVPRGAQLSVLSQYTWQKVSLSFLETFWISFRTLKNIEIYQCCGKHLSTQKKRNAEVFQVTSCSQSRKMPIF